MADEYAKVGAEGHTGTILFGVSGHVNKPGVYELETGTPLTEIINDVCGGVPGGKKIKAIIPGGSSMPPLRGDEIDGVRMDEESLKPAGYPYRYRRHHGDGRRHGHRGRHACVSPTSTITSRAGSARHAARVVAGWRRS